MTRTRTYSQLLLHVVTSTKGRHPWITVGVARQAEHQVNEDFKSELLRRRARAIEAVERYMFDRAVVDLSRGGELQDEQ